MVNLKNPYRGVNAHLNSVLLAKNSWQGFHGAFANEIRRSLSKQLASKGYIVGGEDSLQIQFIPPIETANTYRPDALIQHPKQTYQAPYGEINTLDAIVLELSAVVAIDNDHIPLAIIIEKDGSILAWIEIISPTNKIGGDHLYLRKRLDVLRNGITFLEIDLVHTLPLLIGEQLKPKSKTKTNARFVSTLMLPQPTLEEGHAFIYESNLDEPLKDVLIPLLGNDNVTLHLDDVYQTTFEDFAYTLRVDYTLPPVNFNSYSDADKRKILDLMRRIATQEQES